MQNILAYFSYIFLIVFTYLQLFSEVNFFKTTFH